MCTAKEFDLRQQPIDAVRMQENPAQILNNMQPLVNFQQVILTWVFSCTHDPFELLSQIKLFIIL